MQQQGENVAAPVNFLSYKGSIVKLSPLTLGQQEELAAYLKFHYICEAKKQVDGLPRAFFEYAWDKAKAYADQIYPGRAEHIDAYFTPHGKIYALYLSLKKHDPEITEAKAADILDECQEDAVSALNTAVGYKIVTETQKVEHNNKPLPVADILHILCNDPHNHTAPEVRAMTLDEIANILCAPGADAGTPPLSQHDQQRFIDNWAAEQQRKRLGIWGEKDIWK